MQQDTFLLVLGCSGILRNHVSLLRNYFSRLENTICLTSLSFSKISGLVSNEMLLIKLDKVQFSRGTVKQTGWLKKNGIRFF